MAQNRRNSLLCAVDKVVHQTVGMLTADTVR